MNKKGLSQVVTTLIIILLGIVAIGVVWFVVANLLQEGAENVDIGQFTLNLQVKSVKLDSGNNITVTIKRNTGEGNITALDFIFSDGQNSEIIRRNTTMKELDTATFNFVLTEMNNNEVETVSIAPIYISNSGNEKTGNVANTYEVQAKSLLSVTHDSGTIVDDSSVGSGTWGSPNQAQTSNNVYTSAYISSSETHYLKATNFGFTIPTGATIKGIKVEAESRNTMTVPSRFERVRIVKGGLITGTDLSTDAIVASTDTYYSFGGDNESWGLTWTPSQINSADFGMAISFRTDSSPGSSVVLVDHVRVTVYYLA